MYYLNGASQNWEAFLEIVHLIKNAGWDVHLEDRPDDWSTSDLWTDDQTDWRIEVGSIHDFSDGEWQAELWRRPGRKMDLGILPTSNKK